MAFDQVGIYLVALIPAGVVGYMVYWAQTSGKKKKYIRESKRNQK